jgi:hypothetical protein
METNPYAPPTAGRRRHFVGRPQAAQRDPDDPVQSHLFRRVLSDLVLRRRAALNRLPSPKKLQLWPFVVILVWFLFAFGFGFVAGVNRALTGSVGGLSPETQLVFSIARLAVGILMLVQCFRTKDILEDHFAGPGDQVASPLFADVVQLSGVMTFFFQIFYLQYAINRHLSESTPSTT